MYKEIPGTGQIYLALSKESENIKEHSRKMIKKIKEARYYFVNTGLVKTLKKIFWLIVNTE